jgi:hypothetical protein
MPMRFWRGLFFFVFGKRVACGGGDSVALRRLSWVARGGLGRVACGEGDGVVARRGVLTPAGWLQSLAALRGVLTPAGWL